MKLNIGRTIRFLIGLGVLFCFTSAAMAADATSLTGVAANVSKAIGAIAQIITAGSYIAGIAFMVGAIMKFKQHKDNPTQIPIGTPISLLLIGAALLFFPFVLKIAGTNIFGSTSTIGISGSTAPI